MEKFTPLTKIYVTGGTNLTSATIAAMPDHLCFTNIKGSLEKLAQLCLCGAGLPLSGAGKQKRMNEFDNMNKKINEK